MIPKVDKYEFYLYRDFRNGDNHHNLIQLIAHADEFTDDERLTIAEQKLFSNRIDLCKILFEDEWSSRNGKIHFFFELRDKKHAASYYEKLIQYVEEFNLDNHTSKLQKTLEFYLEHELEIKQLAKYEDENWEEKLKKLENKYTFHYSYAKELASRIVKQPNHYCRDKDGDNIDLNFTGKLRHYLKKGTLRYEYTLVNGQILGEFIEYDNNGIKISLSNRDGYLKRDYIKRWYPNGQLKFEKLNDSGVRYWHSNGQLKLENIDGVIRKWNENGEIIL